jgi:hypothetical protein
MKKDDYLSTIMQVPPKQRVKITPIDLKTQREAFTVSLEGLKGVRFLLVPSYSLHESLFVRPSHVPLLPVESQRASP